MVEALALLFWIFLGLIFVSATGLLAVMTLMAVIDRRWPFVLAGTLFTFSSLYITLHIIQRVVTL